MHLKPENKNKTDLEIPLLVEIKNQPPDQLMLNTD